MILPDRATVVISSLPPGVLVDGIRFKRRLGKAIVRENQVFNGVLNFPLGFWRPSVKSERHQCPDDFNGDQNKDDPLGNSVEHQSQ
jgi:hypothetical protein